MGSTMVLNGCFNCGLVATVAVALLVMPVQYLVPDLYPAAAREPLLELPAPPSGLIAWLDHTLAHFPPLDLFFTISLLIFGFVTYIYDWIQRKIIERRIVKLNQYLGASVERLRARDAQQDQLEATLKMVQTATSEYNLLLYLLLRQHRYLAAHTGPASNCFFAKPMDEDFALVTTHPLDS